MSFVYCRRRSWSVLLFFGQRRIDAIKQCCDKWVGTQRLGAAVVTRDGYVPTHNVEQAWLLLLFCFFSLYCLWWRMKCAWNFCNNNKNNSNSGTICGRPLLPLLPVPPACPAPCDNRPFLLDRQTMLWIWLKSGCVCVAVAVAVVVLVVVAVLSMWHA